jgi:nicotinate-nucleotide--dimethylbenzimidazole phosphoribosyltransferase
LRALEQALREIKPLDKKAMAAARARQDTLTKPLGSLGRLEELSIKLAGIKGEPIPRINHKAIVTMAADHGVVAEGVSAYPQAVTPQMVLNFLHGGAGINVLARHVGARIIVVDMGVASDLEPHHALLSRKIACGTSDMASGPAMSGEQAMKSIEVGLEIVEQEIKKGLDIVGTGDMGIGNTTSSSAITAAITGEKVAKVTGRGTGIDDKQLAHKVEVIERALEVNKPNADDATDVLAKVGGFEIGGLSGVILGAAAHHIPVVMDGFISGAAALIAVGLSPGVKDYLIASHCSVEIGHKAILKYLGLKPILDLELRLGEGTGAALGIFLAEAAAKILAEMATFAEAGVSEKSSDP